MGAQLTGIRPRRPRRRGACGRSTSSHATEPVCSAKTPGAATETPPPGSVDDSRRSIDTSEASSPPYPSRAATESAFHNSSHSAKPSNLGPSNGSSPINGRRSRSPRTPARGVISLPAAPRAATLVRFDLCSEESRIEATRITIGAGELFSSSQFRCQIRLSRDFQLPNRYFEYFEYCVYGRSALPSK